MTLSATMYCENRREERLSTDLGATLRDTDWRPIDIVIEDMSSIGLRIRTAVDLHIGELITLGIGGIGMCSGRVIRTLSDGYGVQFVESVAEGAVQRAMTEQTVVPLQFSSDAKPTVVAAGLHLAWRTRLLIMGFCAVFLWCATIAVLLASR